DGRFVEAAGFPDMDMGSTEAVATRPPLATHSIHRERILEDLLASPKT
ncbi:hypothetical protein P3T24_007798, partial [Paraburkholderia sp. GAS33]